jgi:hypothetical protein
LFPRLEALSGLTFFWAVGAAVEVKCDARLHRPDFHLTVGSGHAIQYQAVLNWILRLQPLHCSTTSWQIPPLKEHPLDVIKGQSLPCFTVAQFIGITPFFVSWKIKSQAK